MRSACSTERGKPSNRNPFCFCFRAGEAGTGTRCVKQKTGTHSEALLQEPILFFIPIVTNLRCHGRCTKLSKHQKNKIYACFASQLSRTRDAMRDTTKASSSRSPRCIMAPASRPRGVPARISARSNCPAPSTRVRNACYMYA